MASLNDFIANVKSEGLMRNNRYIVNFSLPPSLTGSVTNLDLQNILLFCDSATIPGVTISTTPALTFGEVREMPYEKLFSPANFTFYVDNKMFVKKMFDAWQAAIINPQTRHTGYYVDYTTTFEITIFDINQNARYGIKLHEAYLKDISPIQLDYANRDIMKVTATIQYKYWTSSTLNNGLNEYYDMFQDVFKVPESYFSDFNAYQNNLPGKPVQGILTPPVDVTPTTGRGVTPTEPVNVTPNLGGLELSGATYQAP